MIPWLIQKLRKTPQAHFYMGHKGVLQGFWVILGNISKNSGKSKKIWTKGIQSAMNTMHESTKDTDPKNSRRRSKEIAISKTFFRQTQITLTPPKGRGFIRLNKRHWGHPLQSILIFFLLVKGVPGTP